MDFRYLLILSGLILFLGCFEKDKPSDVIISKSDTDTSRSLKEIDDNNYRGDTLPGKQAVTEPNVTRAGGYGADTAHAEHLLNFAKNLLGIPYKYASANPSEGLDCSGFLYYVFHRFNIDVPRSSIDYTNFGTEVPLSNAKPGDFILFTGTDSTDRTAGHIGIITGYENGAINFIHSSSGKAMGVTMSSVKGYYSGRFLKTIRILKNND